MSQGPILIVADQADASVMAAVEADTAFPVVEAAWHNAPAAIARIEPSAIVLAPPTRGARSSFDEMEEAIALLGTPYVPVLALVEHDGFAFPDAICLRADATPRQIAARLSSALRVRTLHATVMRRAHATAQAGDPQPDWPDTDPLEDATVLVAGRGGTYPRLSTAVGERIGLIGALSVETAARYLNARDVDGLVIGDGFGPRNLEALLIALGDDSRFRDLPVAVIPDLPAGIAERNLPNLEKVAGEPAEIIERMLPLVRQHAFEARLQRQLKAFDTQGVIDPQTGLFTVAAFLRDLGSAITDARRRGMAMSIARFTFPQTLDLRASMDAARLASRLVRSVDFACRASDGSILIVFVGSSLRSAHVVARRIASVLRQSALATKTGMRAPRLEPAVMLTSLKATDSVESLLAQVSEPSSVAAE